MSKPPIITYQFRNILEIALYFEEKAEKAARIAKNSGSHIKQRLQYEAAAYYDIVNVLRNCRLEEEKNNAKAKDNRRDR